MIVLIRLERATHPLNQLGPGALWNSFSGSFGTIVSDLIAFIPQRIL